MRDEAEPRRIRVERQGPLLVEGPVTVTGDDGVSATSTRFVVAVCTCRRSRTYPWCDTSHRAHTVRPSAIPTDAATAQDPGDAS
ncbi:CDGSH iron-sulfur domain-containing protein [Streptomyces sp. NBC_01477]|uniref:CDGSH iron-sulfur domain-containing protein n=1 Tax=Streptomyces sp. NBC_01477 TaxID=2976015 RepID=UPI002E37CFF7|nr:CDGSH iron-sulfur domain-containing protein [Streptomyces sp. NBC_01477]